MQGETIYYEYDYLHPTAIVIGSRKRNQPSCKRKLRYTGKNTAIRENKLFECRNCCNADCSPSSKEKGGSRL